MYLFLFLLPHLLPPQVQEAGVYPPVEAILPLIYDLRFRCQSTCEHEKIIRINTTNYGTYQPQPLHSYSSHSLIIPDLLPDHSFLFSWWGWQVPYLPDWGRRGAGGDGGWISYLHKSYPSRSRKKKKMRFL